MTLDEMVLNIQKYLKENYHPHVEISIDSTSYQIKEIHFNSGNSQETLDEFEGF